MQESILETLEARLGTAPYAVCEQIQAIQDEGQLKRLLQRTIQAHTMDEFRNALAASKP